MSNRNVTIKLTTQKDLIVVESNARTFGELKKQLPNIKWDGMRVVERSTKNTLQMDDAVLPAIDFVLFLVPEKVKSGADINPDTASYNDLRSHLAMLNRLKNAGLSLDGKVEDLRERLRQYQSGTISAKAAPAIDILSVIEECRAKINNAIDAIIETVQSQPVDKTQYVFKTSIQDLEQELNEIKSHLKL